MKITIETNDDTGRDTVTVQNGTEVAQMKCSTLERERILSLVRLALGCVTRDDEEAHMDAAEPLAAILSWKAGRAPKEPWIIFS